MVAARHFGALRALRRGQSLTLNGEGFLVVSAAAAGASGSAASVLLRGGWGNDLHLTVQPDGRATLRSAFALGAAQGVRTALVDGVNVAAAPKKAMRKAPKPQRGKSTKSAPRAKKSAAVAGKSQAALRNETMVASEMAKLLKLFHGAAKRLEKQLKAHGETGEGLEKIDRGFDRLYSRLNRIVGLPFHDEADSRLKALRKMRPKSVEAGRQARAAFREEQLTQLSPPAPASSLAEAAYHSELNQMWDKANVVAEPPHTMGADPASALKLFYVAAARLERAIDKLNDKGEGDERELLVAAKALEKKLDKSNAGRVPKELAKAKQHLSELRERVALAAKAGVNKRRAALAKPRGILARFEKHAWPVRSERSDHPFGHQPITTMHGSWIEDEVNERWYVAGYEIGLGKHFRLIHADGRILLPERDDDDKASVRHLWVKRSGVEPRLPTVAARWMVKGAHALSVVLTALDFYRDKGAVKDTLYRQRGIYGGGKKVCLKGDDIDIVNWLIDERFLRDTPRPTARETEAHRAKRRAAADAAERRKFAGAAARTAASIKRLKDGSSALVEADVAKVCTAIDRLQKRARGRAFKAAPQPPLERARKLRQSLATVISQRDGAQDAHQGQSDYEDKRERRIERLQERAEKKQQQSRAAMQAERDILDKIPPGQPILVGHHSEGRHRKDLSRAESHMRKGWRLDSEATALSSRAAAAERNTAISSDDPMAIEKLVARLALLTEEHDKNKAINKAIGRQRQAAKRTDKHNASAKKRLAALGLAEATIAALLKPDVHGTVGLPSYMLSNATASLRRLRQRIEKLERTAKEAGREQTIGEVRVVQEDNRIRLFFPEPPPHHALRKRLRSEGFIFARSADAWQRKPSALAWHAALRLAQAYADAPPTYRQTRDMVKLMKEIDSVSDRGSARAERLKRRLSDMVTAAKARSR